MSSSSHPAVTKSPRLAIDRDRISALYENVISHILSCLPTKDAIRTSILSRDWKHKWTSNYNVDIESGELCTWESFYNSTDRILARSQHLTSFRLICQSSLHDLSRVQEWVSNILRHKIQSFEVNYFGTGLVYQASLLNSTSLRKLKLQHPSFTLNVAIKNCAPNLISSYLFGAEIVNENYNPRNSTSVTFTFPVLETFEATGIKWLNVTCVEIYAPLLTKFIYGPPYIYEKELDYSIALVAPKLTTFDCRGCVPEKISIKYGSSILSASLISEAETDETEFGYLDQSSTRNIALHVGELLNGFTNVEELTISGFIAEFRLNAYDYGGMKSVPSCIISHLEEVEFFGFACKKAFL